MLSVVTLSSMIGSNPPFLALVTMAVKTFPPRLSKPNAATLPAAPLPRSPFSDSTEITLISLDPHIQFVAGKFRGYEKSQPNVETNGRLGLDTNNLCNNSCPRFSYKVLPKPVFLSWRKTTFSYVLNSNYRLSSWS
jgi:hypothetical protein